MLPQGNPSKSHPRIHSATTQKKGADSKAQPGPRRRATTDTAAATSPVHRPQYAASSSVGPHVSGQGIGLYTWNVKFSQRRSNRKKARPASQPQPSAARGLRVSASAKTGATATQAAPDHSGRGKAAASTAPAATDNRTGPKRLRSLSVLEPAGRRGTGAAPRPGSSPGRRRYRRTRGAESPVAPPHPTGPRPRGDPGPEAGRRCPH